MTFRPDLIVKMEEAALDRWGKGDPDGYGEIMAGLPPSRQALPPSRRFGGQVGGPP